MAFAAQQHTSLLIQGLYVLMMPPLWVAWALLLQQSTTVDVLSEKFNKDLENIKKNQTAEEYYN